MLWKSWKRSFNLRSLVPNAAIATARPCQQTPVSSIMIAPAAALCYAPKRVIAAFTVPLARYPVRRSRMLDPAAALPVAAKAEGNKLTIDFVCAQG